MASMIKFTKMHGAGNDYIYVNTLEQAVLRPEATSVEWSKPHFGIGSDGLVLICPPSEGVEADFRMRIFNADGSEALMCGNASRCIGKYLYERRLTRNTDIRLETASGIKILHLTVSGGKVESVWVDMLAPAMHDAMLFDEELYERMGRKVTVDDRTFCGTFVSMGNPHFVIFTTDVENLDIARYGALLERHELFPQRCNIEFAERLENGSLRTRVWERGSGITMACGTGACATSVAATITGVSDVSNDIVMDGGTLHVKWDKNTQHVSLGGPAEFVFDGVIEEL